MIIWLRFIIKSKRSRKRIIIVFIIGIFSIVPILALQYIWLLRPELNLYQTLQQSSSNVHLGFLYTFIAVGVFEEFAKFITLINLKWIKIPINNVNEAMRYALVIALGYAFSENIMYFMAMIKTGQLASLYSVFVLRSTFTIAGHMAFSSIVVYYYSIGKFGNPILEMDKWLGKKHSILSGIKRMLGFKEKNLFLFYSVLRGLLFGMIIHAAFNFALHFQKIDYAFIIVAIGFIWALYLSNKRQSYLVFTRQEEMRPSSIPKKEEDVIIELLGMWFQEEKYNEVIEICNRLKKRDPDNLVVKLFREKAKDARKIKRVRKAIKLLFSDEDYDVQEEEISWFKRMKERKKTKEEQAAQQVEPVNSEEKEHKEEKDEEKMDEEKKEEEQKNQDHKKHKKNEEEQKKENENEEKKEEKKEKGMKHHQHKKNLDIEN
ncbi:PrsW family intramembrane metalloprotease [Patescibacteria group bacterium]